MPEASTVDAQPRLKRELGLPGAVLLGLGSMLGTGVYVSLALATGIAGPGVIPALVIAAILAAANGLSSAQLAAANPVSGATYEYGYRYLSPELGFTAGWMFLSAKTASAATAALGFAAYFAQALGLPDSARTALAMGAVAGLTLIALAGVRRSNAANAAILLVTVGGLLAFMLAALPHVQSGNVLPPWPRAGAGPVSGLALLLHAAALMFVSYTGYGRVATMGEEVHHPHTTIPRAILITVAVSLALYLIVAVAAIGAAGADGFAAALDQRRAPLQAVLASVGVGLAQPLVAAGAVAAMLGVLLNLILGMSRVVLAMGRRGDLPAGLARLNAARTTPYWAVAIVGAAIAALAAIGSIKLAWSLSAFTVLVYYALTNACALRLPPAERMYPRWHAIAALTGCLGLAAFIEWRVMLTGLGLIAAGLLLRLGFRALPQRN